MGIESGRTIGAYGLSTNYHEAGSGAPLILLHGSGPGVSAWTNWSRAVPILARHFRTIAFDLAGFGLTERRENFDYNIKSWVKHFIAILDALGIDRANIVGNSFGGSVALAVAARHPDRVSALCLMGVPCDKFVMTPGLRAGWDYTPSMENMRAVMSHFPFDQSIITDQLVRERYETSLIPGAQEGLRNLLAKPAAEGETILSGIAESVVATIEHRALVLHGREDCVIPVEMGIRLARSMPNADLHLFAKCGHWVNAERFDGFIDLVLRHFSEKGRS